MAEIDLTTKLKAFPKITEISLTDEKNVHLEWTKVDLAEKYDIKRSEKPVGGYVHIDWATELQFTDESAGRDTTYWYKVIAWKRMEGKKTSTKASSVKPIVISDIPAVSDLKAETADKQINLTWKGNGCDKFFIYRISDHFSRPVLIGESDKPQFTDCYPVSGQAYRYMVQSAKKGDEKLLHGNFSNQVNGIFLDKALILSRKSSLGKAISLTLRLVAGCNGYILERSDSKNGTFTEVMRTDELTSNVFEDKVPSRFKSYFYRVCAYRVIGNEEFRGDYSEIIAVRSR